MLKKNFAFVGFSLYYFCNISVVFMQINLTYTLDDKKLIPDVYYEVLGYYGLSAKNIKNSALFIIKNILTSYSYNKEKDSYSSKLI